MKFLRIRFPLGVAAACFTGSTIAAAAAAFPQTAAQAAFDVKPAPLSYVKTPATSVPPAAHAFRSSKDHPPAGTAIAAGRPDHSRMHYVDSDGELWARGASYKARFASGGFEYTPLFGAKAPTNYPLELDVASAMLAGQSLAFQSSVQPEREGDRVVFHRGPFDETYDLAPRELEQSFVFTDLPSRGELSLRIAYSGEYTVQPILNGVRFAHELGSVECTRAVAFDASGKRIDLAIDFDGQMLAIDVPAAFVAAAQLPLTIDPVLTAFIVDDTSGDDTAADLAYDAQTDTWRTVYEEQVSQTDVDLYTFAFDSTGAAVSSSGFYIDASPERWAHARIANNAIAKQFFVVAEVGAIGSRVVKGLWISAVTQGHGTPFVIESSAGTEMFNPDIGGDPSLIGPTYYCVVFERAFSATDHDIWARTIENSGALHTPNALIIDSSSGTLDSHPSISKCDGAAPSWAQDWYVVWERQATPTDRDIVGARVHWTGQITDPTFVVSASGEDESAPRVSSPLDMTISPRPVLVAAELNHPWNDADIELIAMSGPTVVTSVNLSQIEGFDAERQSTPAIDCVGGQFAVAYTEEWYPGSYDYDLFVAHVALSGNSISLTAQRDVLAWTGDIEARPALCAELSGGALGHECCALWDVDVGGAKRHDVRGSFLDSPAGGAVESYCGSGAVACPCGNTGLVGRGCGNSSDAQGALLGVQGSASVSNDTLTLTAIGMPPTASCLFFEGTSTIGVPFGDGVKCVGGQIIRLPLKISVNGSASYPQAGDPSISVKGLVPAIGATRYYQAWYRDPAGFCTNATFNVSNALKITWVP